VWFKYLVFRLMAAGRWLASSFQQKGLHFAGIGVKNEMGLFIQRMRGVEAPPSCCRSILCAEKVDCLNLARRPQSRLSCSSQPNVNRRLAGDYVYPGLEDAR
jgi:hypothetical protein